MRGIDLLRFLFEATQQQEKLMIRLDDEKKDVGFEMRKYVKEQKKNIISESNGKNDQFYN